MADQITEPAESVSQELRGVVDTGEESFAVDGISEKAEEKGEKAPAKEEKPEEKPGEEKPEEEEEKPAEEKPAEEKPGEKPPAEPSEEELPKGIKKRLATITRKRHDAERETATIREENAELLTRIEALEHPVSETGEEPQVDDYDTEEEYLDACIEYKADQKIAERDAAWQVEQKEKIRKEQETKAEERQEAFQAELKKGVEKFEDFEDVIEDLNITGDMISILESFPNIAEVVYELGKNPDTVTDLVGMSFLQAAYRMKEISNGLTKKKTTKAPAPVKPVSTSGGAIKSLEQMSQAEYNAHRDKQDAERKGMY